MTKQQTAETNDKLTYAYRVGYLEQTLAHVRDKLASGGDRRKIIDDIDQTLGKLGLKAKGK
jgi:hypothetical protein